MTQVTTNPLEIAKHCYDLFAQGDIETLTNQYFSPNVQWTEPAPLPEGGTHYGPEAVVEHVFGAFNENWGEDATVNASHYICEGNQVVAIGNFEGNKNGESYSIPFCHVMTIENGRLVKFANYTDTATALDIINA